MDKYPTILCVDSGHTWAHAYFFECDRSTGNHYQCKGKFSERLWAMHDNKSWYDDAKQLAESVVGEINRCLMRLRNGSDSRFASRIILCPDCFAMRYETIGDVFTWERNAARLPMTATYVTRSDHNHKCVKPKKDTDLESRDKPGDEYRVEMKNHYRVPHAAKGTVYIIKACGRIKIGITSGPLRNRLKSLSTSCPEAPVLVASKNAGNANILEKRLHSMFHARRTNGEWFEGDIERDAVTALMQIQ